jgi:hypothetical protein
VEVATLHRPFGQVLTVPAGTEEITVPYTGLPVMTGVPVTTGALVTIDVLYTGLL